MRQRIRPNLLGDTLASLSRYEREVFSHPRLHTLWQMSNLMTMTRLGYNDHGPTHARIVAEHALNIYNILLPVRKNRGWSWCGDSGLTEDHGRVITLMSAILHDIGNAIHREQHEYWSVVLAEDILDYFYHRWFDDEDVITKMKTETLHAILTHESLPSLTLEGSCVKIGDALDMTKGRSRIPMIRGRFSIHSESANAITRVEVKRNKVQERPLRINVYMDNPAGVFQVDQHLIPRIKGSVIGGSVELMVYIRKRRKRLLL